MVSKSVRFINRVVKKSHGFRRVAGVRLRTLATRHAAWGSLANPSHPTGNRQKTQGVTIFVLWLGFAIASEPQPQDVRIGRLPVNSKGHRQVEEGRPKAVPRVRSSMLHDRLRRCWSLLLALYLISFVLPVGPMRRPGVITFIVTFLCVPLRILLANSAQATSRTNRDVRVAARGMPPNQSEIR
jgi:hypothetical protein